MRKLWLFTFIILFIGVFSACGAPSAAPAGDSGGEVAPAEAEADDSDDKAGVDDVCEGMRGPVLVLVPHELSEPVRRRERLGRDEDHPADPHRDAQACEDERKGGRDDDLEEAGPEAEAEDSGDVQVVLVDGRDTKGGVDEGWPDCAHRNCAGAEDEQRRQEKAQGRDQNLEKQSERIQKESFATPRRF